MNNILSFENFMEESISEVEKCIWTLEYFAENAGRVSEQDYRIENKEK